jgi:hypothetical protein
MVASMFGGLDLEFLPSAGGTLLHRIALMGGAALFVLLGVLAASATLIGAA